MDTGDSGKVLKGLTQFFVEKVSLQKGYRPRLIAEGLLDEQKIKPNLTPQEWTLEVLDQVRLGGPNAFRKFVSIFRQDSHDEWILQELERCSSADHTDNRGPCLHTIKAPHKDYIVREALERDCVQKLNEEKATALKGMAGSGKTLLARRIAQLLMEDHRRAEGANGQSLPGRRIELDCSSDQTLESSLYAQTGEPLQKAVGAEQTLPHIIDNLPKKGLNIIIFDNFLSSSWLKDWLDDLVVPENTYMIINSQDEHVMKGISIKVGGLTTEEACCLARQVMEKPPSKDEINELCELLVGNVLGLITAFKHMEISKIQPVKYIDNIKDQWKIPCPLEFKAIFSDYEMPLSKVLEISIKEMKATLASRSSNAERVLNVLAFLQSSNIPIDDVALVLDREDYHETVSSLVEALTRNMLAEVELLEDGKRALHLHRIVQVVLHCSVGSEGKCAVLADVLSVLCHYCDKDTRFSSNFQMQVTLMPHAHSALQHVRKGSLKNKDPTIIKTLWLLLSLGHMKTQQQKPKEARQLLHLALETAEETLLDSDIDLKELSLINVDRVCQDICDILMKKSEEAETLQDIENFIYTRRVPEETLKMWVSVCEDKRRSWPFNSNEDFLMDKDRYDKLSNKKFACALDINIVKNYFLIELISSLLYTSGRVYSYLKQPELKEQSHAQLRLAKKLCECVEHRYLSDCEYGPVGLLHTELTSRNGLLYFLLDENTFRSAEQAKNEYEHMRNNACKRYEFGLLKMTPDDAYRTLTIMRQLIRSYTIMLASDDVEDRDKLEGAALSCLKDLEQSVEDFEIQNRSIHSKASYWNGAGNLLLECTTNQDENSQEAEKYFLKACRIEQGSSNLNYPWWEAILGLVKLFRKDPTKAAVLDDNLRGYLRHVLKVKEESPAEDYKDQYDRVHNLWQQLKKDSKFRRLDLRRRSSITMSFRDLRRSFSQSDNDILDSDDALDLSVNHQPKQAAIQENGSPQVGQEEPQDAPFGDFGNVIFTVAAEQCEEEGNS